ncbi:hypothetical protein KP509_25G042900 [Ceratopteris richardii]|uniref:Peptidase S26 domain-containing protein n=1 Tax=Ceratopteris richardii TaxID=49495 RepID=A0A8T2RR50_CERRI|nr:hypothetical protein KP509_25G042900 [Ceratopteris richardii]
MSQWFPKLKPLGREVWERSVLLTQFLCCIHIIKEHVVEIHQVMGPSMLPTFSAVGDVLLVERLSTKFQRIKQGDVVMALSPENPRLIVCKRVLGLEGENLVVMPTHGSGRVQHIKVPKGHVWLQGDNLSNSTDSRHYGPVPYGLLRGKVFLRVWPPGGWTRF